EGLASSARPREAPEPPARAANVSTRLGASAARLDDIGNAVLDVLDGLDSQGPVVEVHEPLAEARRAADVRREDGDPPREQCLVGGIEHRPLLRLRAAVEAEHDGAGTARLARSVEPDAEREPVAGPELDRAGAYQA